MSAKLLIQVVVGVLGAAVIAVLGVGLANSWRVAAQSDRQLQITSVIREAFEALTTVRLEVTVLTTQWHEAAPATADQRAREARSYEAMSAASRRAVEGVRTTVFDGHEALASTLENSYSKLDVIHGTILQGVSLRGAERSGDPSSTYFTESEALQRTLGEVVGTAVFEAKRTDNVLSQLYQLHELAWQCREAAGQAYRVVSLAFRGQLPSPDIARSAYASANDVLVALWNSVQNAARSSALPDGLRKSVEAGRAAFFASDLVDRNQRTFDALVAGRIPELTYKQWSDLNRQRLGIPERVAVAALDLAADHARAMRAAASWRLGFDAGLLLGSLIFTLGAMAVVGRRLLKPLLTLRDAMLEVASGELVADIPFVARRDEIGALAGALRVFRQSALDLREAAIGQAAERDAKTQRMLRLEALVHGFEATMTQMSEHIGVSATQLDATARVLSESNKSTSAGAENVDAAGCEASASAQTVAAATDQLSSSIAVVRSNVEKSNDITAQAVADVCRSEQIVRALTERADRIGAVVGLIRNIAGQTNLLALNATIEAARAGDAGKGFAVVASEVKGLATETAKATAEIGLQIDEIQAATRQAAEAFHGLTALIDDISAIAKSIASAVQQQDCATSEIARTAQQTTAAAQEINAHIAAVSHAAHGTDTAAGQVLGAAGDLSKQAERLATEVFGFTRAVRAA